MFEPLWWHWVVLGFALMLAELMVGTFYIFWFGLSALVVGAVLALLPGMAFSIQMLIWILASSGLIYAWFRVFKPGSHKTLIGTASSEVIGEAGLLLHEVAPFQRGEVRFQKPILGSETWPCISEESIAAGARVVVVQIEGSLLKVAQRKS